MEWWRKTGAITSLRVPYDTLEVEYGIGGPSCAAFPQDRGTERVLRDGFKAIYDRKTRMTRTGNVLLALERAESSQPVRDVVSRLCQRGHFRN